MSEKLVVVYGGDPVDDPWLYAIKVVNTGKQSVQSHDFVEPVTLIMRDNLPVDMLVSEASSADLLNMELEIELLDPDHGSGSVFAISGTPRLMNPGDWFTLQAITDGAPSSVAVQCRFAGQRRPMADRIERSQQRLSRSLVAGQLTLGVVAIGLAWNDAGAGTWALPAVAAIFLCLVTAPYLWDLVRAWRNRRKRVSKS